MLWHRNLKDIFLEICQREENGSEKRKEGGKDMRRRLCFLLGSYGISQSVGKSEVLTMC